MHLVKRIPVAAGLGGGSSDAAAALLAANLGWELGWSRGELAELGSQLGSDVPFFLGSPAAICRGRGEQVVPVAGLGRCMFVLVTPPTGLSTAAVYGRCRPDMRPRRVAAMVSAARSRGPAGIGQHLWNRLEAAASQLCPSVGRLSRELGRVELHGHQMSGSGSSHFGIGRHARHARRVAGILRARRVGRVVCVPSCTTS
jgi:4-diphosphocytidyl-2-C-methyl-D-erythritol kinase